MFMLRILIFFLIFLFLIMSCSEKPNKNDRHVLSKPTAKDSSGDIEGVNIRDFLRRKTWIKKHFSEITDSQRISKQPIKIKVFVIKRLRNEDYRNQEGIFDSVRVDYTNVTDSIIYFWSYNAFWTKNWITNSTDIDFNYGVTRKMAYSNVRPYRDQISPNETCSRSIALQYLGDRNEMKNRIFHLGLVCIKYNEIDSLGFHSALFKKLSETKDIMWSEPFKLK